MSTNRNKTTGSIIAYKLVNAHGPSDLNMAVRKLMDEGWKVHHGPQVAFVPADSQFAAGISVFQAMVKYSHTDPIDKSNSNHHTATT
jgi:hypothetical protein